MGSTKVSTPAPVQAPPPTAEEIAIQKQQLSLMKKQSAQLDALQPLFEGNIASQKKALADQKALRPWVLSGMGLTEVDGVLRKMTEEEFQASLSDVDRAARENTLLSLERDRKALSGELPLTEAGQQAKADEFRVFKEAMARAGHIITGDDPLSATADTTPGIQALSAFNERFGLLEEAERFGQLDRASSGVLARMGIATDIGAKRTSGLVQFPGASNQSFVARGAPAYGAAAGQYGGLLDAYQFTRNQQLGASQFNATQQFNAKKASAANQAAMYGGLMEAGGTIVGARLGRAPAYVGARLGRAPA